MNNNIKFNKWSTNKKNIDSNEYNKIFNEGEIWFVSIGKNIGFEEDGKGENFSRPVLILKKFNKNIFYGIPLTSVKKEDKFHYGFNGKTGKISYAILSQMKLIDGKRLEEKIGYISFPDMRELKQKLKKLIF